MRSGWTSVGIGVLITLVVAVVIAFLIQPMQGRWYTPRTESTDNVRTLLTLSISRSTEAPSGLRGRNWILALVPEAIDPRNRQNLDALWPPNSPELEELDLSAYKALTPELLKTERFLHLTGYVGPGADDPSWKGPRPLIGDLTFDDGAIVGFTDGRARWLDREELGLGDDDPIRAGPTSKSPLLRMLSDE